MRHLQEIYEKYKDNDMVILGFNCTDDKQIALDFMQENSATFPNILDSSYAARKLYLDDYRVKGVPTNYIIDREGKIVDSWLGYEEGHKRAIEVLEKSGVKPEVR
jgi:glutathione peroxidase-family protein